MTNALSRDSPILAPCIITVAPNFLQFSTFMIGATTGMQTVTGIPKIYANITRTLYKMIKILTMSLNIHFASFSGSVSFAVKDICSVDPCLMNFDLGTSVQYNGT